MDPSTIGALGFLALVIMVMTGVHIVFATAITGFLGIVALKGWPVAVNIAGIIPHSAGSNYLFSVLPMFILIGFFASTSGMVQGAYRAAKAWIGWMPGGLAVSTVLAAGAFGAVSGASQATAAVFARVAIPELLKLKYSPSISAAAVAAAGTLASLFRRRITFAGLQDSLVETAKLTVMIFSTFWGVFIFARFLAFTRLPTEIAEWLVALPFSPTTILIAILAGYAFLGMFLSASGMMLLTLPVIFPAIVELGIDPILFGILVIKMVEIGFITPPVGLNVYVVAGVRPDIPIASIFGAIWPFVLIDILTVALLIIFPSITLFLPTLVLGAG